VPNIGCAGSGLRGFDWGCWRFLKTFFDPQRYTEIDLLIGSSENLHPNPFLEIIMPQLYLIFLPI
jgi:hypothetical protein